MIEPLIAEGLDCLAAGKVKEATACALQAVSLAPESSAAWSLSANVKAQLGMLDDAMCEYHKARNLDPTDAAIWFHLADLHGRRESLAEELAHLQQAVRLDPEEVTFRASYGDSLLRNGRVAEAIDELRRCHESEPDVRLYRQMLGAAYLSAAQAGWDPHEGQIYATRLSQVTEAERYAEEASAVAGDILAEEIAVVQRNVALSRSRKFTGNWVPIGLGGVVGTMMLPGETFFMGLWYVGGAIAYFFASRTPWYIVNRRLFTGKGGKGSSAFIHGMATDPDRSGRWMAMALATLLVTVVMPVMALWNGAKNYLLLPED